MPGGNTAVMDRWLADFGIPSAVLAKLGIGAGADGAGMAAGGSGKIAPTNAAPQAASAVKSRDTALGRKITYLAAKEAQILPVLDKALASFDAASRQSDTLNDADDALDARVAALGSLETVIKEVTANTKDATAGKARTARAETQATQAALDNVEALRIALRTARGNVTFAADEMLILHYEAEAKAILADATQMKEMMESCITVIEAVTPPEPIKVGTALAKIITSMVAGEMARKAEELQKKAEKIQWKDAIGKLALARGNFQDIGKLIEKVAGHAVAGGQDEIDDWRATEDSYDKHTAGHFRFRDLRAIFEAAHANLKSSQAVVTAIYHAVDPAVALQKAPKDWMGNPAEDAATVTLLVDNAHTMLQQALFLKERKFPGVLQHIQQIHQSALKAILKAHPAPD